MIIVILSLLQQRKEKEKERNFSEIDKSSLTITRRNRMFSKISTGISSVQHISTRCCLKRFQKKKKKRKRKKKGKKMQTNEKGKKSRRKMENI